MYSPLPAVTDPLRFMDDQRELWKLLMGIPQERSSCSLKAKTLDGNCGPVKRSCATSFARVCWN